MIGRACLLCDCRSARHLLTNGLGWRAATWSRSRRRARRSGDRAAFHDTDAYGANVSSNYDSRPLVPEVTVEGDRAGLIRGRQTVGELPALEEGLPEDFFSRDR